MIPLLQVSSHSGPGPQEGRRWGFQQESDLHTVPEVKDTVPGPGPEDGTLTPMPTAMAGRSALPPLPQAPPQGTVLSGKAQWGGLEQQRLRALT